MCGGTLVDQKTVVTASHCIDFGGMDFNVYLGVQSLKKKDVDAVKIKVVKIINVILDLRHCLYVMFFDFFFQIIKV